MKKAILAMAVIFSLSSVLMAQQTTQPKQPTTPKKAEAPRVEERKEIFIEKKEGGKNEKMTIVIDDGKVTINGKPADQYKGDGRIIIDDDIVINGNMVRVPGARGGVTMRKAEPRAFLGVSTEKNAKGAEVTEVIEESAALKAGLQKNDIITSVNGVKVSDSETLLEAVRKCKPGQQVDVAFLREGKEKKVKATLGKTDDAYAYTMPQDYMREVDRNFNFSFEPYMMPGNPRGGFAWTEDRPKFGMGVEDNPDGDGVKVSNVEAESQAAKAGLQKEDIITEVEGNVIKNVDELREELAEGRDKSSLSVKVLRNGKPESLTLRVPKKIKTADL
jgi:serine protease Do